MQVCQNQGIKQQPLYPADSPEIVQDPSRIALSVIQGVSAYLLKHSRNETDRESLRDLSLRPISEATCRKISELIFSYEPFIKVVPDAENYWGKADSCFIALEKQIEIENRRLDADFRPYRTGNPGIIFFQDEEKVSFNILTISSTGFNALNNYRESCCSLF